MRIPDRSLITTAFLLLFSNLIQAQPEVQAEKLMTALKEENPENASVLVQNVNDVNYRDENNMSLLIVASYRGYIDVCKALINKGANINLQADNGATALIMASLGGHTELAKLLLDNGANSGLKSGEGKTAYDYANNMDIKTLLITFYSPLTTPDQSNIGTRTDKKKQKAQGLSDNGHDILLLLSAAGKGDTETVKNLIETGYTIDERSKEGFTALMIASNNKQYDMVSYLLTLGASPNAITPVNDKEEATVSTFGWIGICKDEDTFSGLTPLFLAAKAGASDIVQLLLNKGADINSTTGGGASALYIACQSGNVEVVKVLLESKAKPDLLTDFGWSPLFVAAYKGYSDIVKLLLEAGANVNAPGKMLMIKTAVKDISEPMSENVEQVTALYIAALAGRADIVNLLLLNGANPNLKTNTGKTPLDAAIYIENDTVIKLLR
jgi:ankyrin repeat protein